MLHIVTPLYRFENLEKIYYSINADLDIVWHITKSNKREAINLEFTKNDNRIILYNVDCEDNEIYKKRNEVLKKINDGYFCFLDDDTIFHENMYKCYYEYSLQNYKGMIIGQQLDKNDKLRLFANEPKYTKIDTGNVLVHHSCLSNCEWPSKHRPGKNAKDSIFWESVFEFYDRKCVLINKPISYYNKLS